MPPRSCAAAGLAAVLLSGLALLGSVLACANAPAQPAGPSRPAPGQPSDRDALATLAAAAKDLRYIATYTLSAAGARDRMVTVAIATDGSWVVAVPAGAMGGLADVAVFRSRDGLFQCALGPAAGASTARPDLAPVTPGCVRVRALSPATDPRVQHLFTDWIDAFIDRGSAISVAAAPVPPGVRGRCFSIEPTSAALAAPVDPGTYCYAADGTLTGAVVGFGTLVLAGPLAPAPPAVAQPAPTGSGPPLPMTAPPTRPLSSQTGHAQREGYGGRATGWGRR